MSKSSKKAKISHASQSETEIEEIDRQSFTPGWSKSISQHEGLPIKRGGKIVRITKDAVVENEATSEEESDDEVEQDKNDEQSAEKVKAVPSEFEFVNDDINDVNDETILQRPNTDIAVQKSDMKFTAKSVQTMHKMQQKLADICTAITVNPERSLKRKVEITEGGERIYRMVDLFELLNSKDIQIFEMSMLSALLVFKDICPGYRIRPQEENDTGVLKKETKALRDYELALLAAYKKYLQLLDEKVQIGLGNPRKETVQWGVAQKLGLSALRCMCELVRSLSHFNFKSLLLAVLVTRGAQPNDEISTLCCETITHVVVNDTQGETSYEIVRLIAKVLVTNKYDVPHRIVQCLERVKMAVHADDSKNVHRRAKRERRKRKKGGDDVETGLLESKATSDESAKKRFQADCLTEISLIYFRIVKMKVGFGLLPVALEGLGAITHLINMETVEDLIALMRGVLEATPPAPELIQLLCVHCALRTLSGPGQELKIDEEIYLMKLRGLIRELPADFEKWDVVLDCLDLCFLKKREERNSVVVSFVKLLMVVSVHMTLSGANALLAMAHAILLRYPRARQGLAAMATYVAQSMDEEEKVVDLAMQALRDGNDHQEFGHDTAGDLDGDGSWVLPLLKHHMDTRYKHIVAALTSKDLLPMPLRASDAKYDPVTKISDRLQATFQALPSTLRALNNAQKNRNQQGSHVVLVGDGEAVALQRPRSEGQQVKTKRGFAGDRKNRAKTANPQNNGHSGLQQNGGPSNFNKSAAGKSSGSSAPPTNTAKKSDLNSKGKPKFGKNRK